MGSSKVNLYVYDISRGLAKAHSSLFLAPCSLICGILGKQIDGIWHTSVVVFNKEYFFGAFGIHTCDPGATILGNPDRIMLLGVTHIPSSLFQEYLASLSSTTFRGSDYDLIHHNCNNFSNEVAEFLCGKTIPEEILRLPQALLSTMIDDNLEVNESEHKKERLRESATVFKDIQPAKEFEELLKNIEDKLGQEPSVADLRQYAVENEGNLLHDKRIPSSARVHLLRLLASAGLKEDMILLLHLDRKDHALMNYAAEIDRLPIEEQEATALLLCNLFEHRSSSEWLMYISEWERDSKALNNIRVTTKVAVNALLGDTANLQEIGVAMVHNLASKEKLTLNLRVRKLLPKGALNKVFDDVATEISMAILQFLTQTPAEENLFILLHALLRFAQIAYNEVPTLIAMIGPHPTQFLGTSARIDQIIQELNALLPKHQ